MNVVELECVAGVFREWLECLFLRSGDRTEKLLVPSLVLYEVFKRVLQQRDEGARAPGGGCDAAGRRG